MQQSESLVVQTAGHRMQMLGEGLPQMVPLKDGPTRYVLNTSLVISFQLSPMGLSSLARCLMKTMKARRIPR
jgi:hypothetical protein